MGAGAKREGFSPSTEQKQYKESIFGSFQFYEQQNPENKTY